MRDLRQTYSDYKAYWDALYDAAFGHYEALNKLPPVAYVRKIASKLYQKVRLTQPHRLVSTCGSE